MATNEENLKIYSGSEFVRVNVTNSRNDNVAFDIKFSKGINIEDLKVHYHNY